MQVLVYAMGPMCTPGNAGVHGWPSQSSHEGGHITIGPGPVIWFLKNFLVALDIVKDPHILLIKTTSFTLNKSINFKRIKKRMVQIHVHH